MIGNLKVSSIKIDTEGHEYEVLLGSENIIKNFKPQIIFEINETAAQKCINFLTKYNYTFFMIDDLKNKLRPLNENNNKVKLRMEGVNCLATPFPEDNLFSKYI